MPEVKLNIFQSSKLTKGTFSSEQERLEAYAEALSIVTQAAAVVAGEPGEKGKKGDTGSPGRTFYYSEQSRSPIDDYSYYPSGSAITSATYPKPTGDNPPPPVTDIPISMLWNGGGSYSPSVSNRFTYIETRPDTFIVHFKEPIQNYVNPDTGYYTITPHSTTDTAGPDPYATTPPPPHYNPYY